MTDSKRPDSGGLLAVLSVLATVATGIAGWVMSGGGPLEARGACLIAAAIAFGLLSNAMLRK